MTDRTGRPLFRAGRPRPTHDPENRTAAASFPVGIMIWINPLHRTGPARWGGAG